MTNEQRTTAVFAKVMSSLITFLNFTGEEKSMFPDNTLPTLDTALWLNEGRISFKFYEKPTVSNQVVNANTAIPRSCIISSLIQETVRRLKNSSPDMSHSCRTDILSKFASKMVNSGHSVGETKKVLVKGVTKYLFLLDNSHRPRNDANFRPLYVGKDYLAPERQLKKYMAKMNWFRNGSSDGITHSRE